MNRVLSNNIPKADRINLSDYPLQKSFLVLGILLGLIILIITNSLILSLSVFSLFFVSGVLWRRDEPPVLSFAFAYQWLYVVSGYFFFQIFGRYPNYSQVGNIENAIIYSLISFIIIATALRLVFFLSKNLMTKKLNILKANIREISISRLFYIVVAVHIINWFIVISPMQILFNAAQIFYNILSLQDVMLLSLLFVVLHQRRGYRYAFFAFLIALIPRFASDQSTFKELFFLLLIAFSVSWKPWLRIPNVRRKNFTILILVTFILLVLLYMAILWEGAIKKNWRGADIEGSTTQQLKAFYEISKDPVNELVLSEGFERLISRVSSVEQFSFVIEIVPFLIPHEEGKLISNTFEHLIKPRFLFPNKPGLPRDSWMVEKYAGMKVHPNASVGIGYMAEFYVDFGVFGMFVMTFMYGLFLGLVYLIITLRSTSYYMFLACVTIPFISNFLSYEGNFTKLIGGILVSVFVITLFLKLISPTIIKSIQFNKSRKYIPHPTLLGGFN